MNQTEALALLTRIYANDPLRIPVARTCPDGSCEIGYYRSPALAKAGIATTVGAGPTFDAAFASAHEPERSTARLILERETPAAVHP